MSGTHSKHWKIPNVHGQGRDGGPSTGSLQDFPSRPHVGGIRSSSCDPARFIRALWGRVVSVRVSRAAHPWCYTRTHPPTKQKLDDALSDSCFTYHCTWCLFLHLQLIFVMNNSDVSKMDIYWSSLYSFFQDLFWVWVIFLMTKYMVIQPKDIESSKVKAWLEALNILFDIKKEMSLA